MPRRAFLRSSWIITAALLMWVAPGDLSLAASGGARTPSATFTACTSALPFGIPEVTTTDETDPVCHPGYAALEDEQLRVPRWVAYRLTSDHLFGCVSRKNDFHIDEELPAGDQSKTNRR